MNSCSRNVVLHLTCSADTDTLGRCGGVGQAGLESQLVKVKSEKEALALEVEREEGASRRSKAVKLS